MQSISIGNRAISLENPPFIIAELSGNHNKSLERALMLVDAAAMAGADAIKIQTYTPDTMTLNVDRPEFKITNPESLWYGKTFYELYQEAYLPWEWHEKIFEYANDKGLLAFSTPFDITAVEFLQKLKAPCFKIASFELTDVELIKACAATGKPMIISTGMGSIAEIGEAADTARSHGCDKIALLKCTSAYPAKPENANLATIANLRATFGAEAGLSDHSLGIGVAIAGVALGATIVEKHLTLQRADGGVDAAFSMEPEEFAQMVKECRAAWAAKGKIQYGPSSDLEKSKRGNRRSLYFTADLKAGDMASRENVRAIRPGGGLPVKYLRHILGHKVSHDLSRGAPVSWDDFM